jgi:hypothetical protein
MKKFTDYLTPKSEKEPEKLSLVEQAWKNAKRKIESQEPEKVIPIQEQIVYVNEQVEETPAEFIFEEVTQEPTTIVETVTVQGEIGPQGIQGPKGDRGETGPMGVAGPMGPKGDRGDKGDDGDIGPQGPEGIQGPVGPQGERGEKGDQGEQGPQGTIGLQGAQGIQGERGDKGEQGLPGRDGVDGQQGPQGEKGDIGTQGPIGLTGPQGERGEKGEKGDKGDVGPQGEKGESGDVGPQGPKGKDGVSPDIKPFAEKFNKLSLDINKKVGRIVGDMGALAGGGGSGSYWLNDLGDTDYSSIVNATDGQVLTYDTNTKKWKAADATGGVGGADTVARNKATSAYIQANSAFDQANTGTTIAQEAFNYANTLVSYSTDQWVRNQANSAYIKANAAFDYANTLTFTTDPSAGVYANSAFNKANSANILAQAAYDYANTLSSGSSDQWARNQANTAFVQSNTPSNTANSSSSYANSAFITANASFTFANTVNVYSYSAFAQANAAFVQANTPSHVANSASSYANSAFIKANAAFNYANTLTFTTDPSAGVYANAAFVQANTANLIAQASFDKANTISANTVVTQGIDNAQNTNITIVGSYANSAFSVANSAFTSSNGTITWNTANSASSYANGSFTVANNALTSSNGTIIGSYANSAYQSANSAGVYANAAFALANTHATTSNVVIAWNTANAASLYANSAYSLANTAITTSGGSITGRLNVAYTPTSTTGYTLQLTAANTVGGTSYADFLCATNASGGATSPNKSFRINNIGTLEVINSAYTGTLLAISDVGQMSLGGAATSVNDPTTNFLSFNNNNLAIYDDGNPHIHSRANGASMWINTNNGAIILGNQSVFSGAAAASAIIMGNSTTTKAYVNIWGGKTYSIGSYGFLYTGGAGSSGSGTTGSFGLYVDQRVQASEFDATSDERAKDIHGTIPLEQAIKFVKDVDGIHYTWNKDAIEGADNKLKAGFGAQKVHKAGFDHMIDALPNGKMKQKVDEDGWVHPEGFQFTMGYNQAIPYHHEVIKHLLDRIQQLEDMVAKLTKE